MATEYSYDFSSFGFSQNVTNTLDALWQKVGWQDTHKVGFGNLGQLVLALAVSTQAHDNDKKDESEGDKVDRTKFIEAMKTFKESSLKAFVEETIEVLWPTKDTSDQRSVSWTYTTGKAHNKNTGHYSYKINFNDAVTRHLGEILKTFKFRLNKTANFQSGPQDEGLVPYFNEHKARCNAVLEKLDTLFSNYCDVVLSQRPERPERTERSAGNRTFEPRNGGRFLKSGGAFDLSNVHIPPGHVVMVVPAKSLGQYTDKRRNYNTSKFKKTPPVKQDVDATTSG